MNHLGLAAALACGIGCAEEGFGDLKFDSDGQTMDVHFNYGEPTLCPDSDATEILNVGVDEIDLEVFNPNEELRLERDGFANEFSGDRVLGAVPLVVDDLMMNRDKDAGEFSLKHGELGWHLCFDSQASAAFVDMFVTAAENYDSVRVSCIGNRQIKADMEDYR